MRKRNAAPAIAWIIAAIFVVAPYIVATRLAPDPEGDLLAIHRLDRIHDGSVVFIGSSLTKCGVPYDPQFEALAAAEGLHLDFVRITLPTATQEDYAQVLDRIGTSRAGLVLIEAEMLLRQPDRWQRRYGVFGMANNYMEQMRALGVVLGLTDKEKSENTGDRECKLLDRSVTQEKLDDQAGIPRAIRTDPWPQSFSTVVGSGNIHGKKVVLVSLGRSSGLEARVDPAYREQFRLALQEIRVRGKTELWVFPADKLPDADYSDGAHLNARGRAAFAHWLIEQLTAGHAGN